MANIPGKLSKFKIDDSLRGQREAVQKAEAAVKGFFNNSNNAFQGKAATVVQLMHISESDPKLHITVHIEGIKKVGQFDQVVPTYWYCKGDNTFWKDAVHVREDDDFNKPDTYVEITEELWNIRDDNLNNRGKDTYWFYGENDAGSDFWPKNTTIPQVIADALPKVKRVEKEVFVARPPVFADHSKK